MRAGVEILEQAGGFTVDDLAARLGGDYDAVLVALGRARRANLVRETGSAGGAARYAVTIEGFQRLDQSG